MPAESQTVWGPGPHHFYHSFGQDVVVAAYDSNSGEVIEGAIIKAMWGHVEVTLPGPTANGTRIVVVG